MRSIILSAAALAISAPAAANDWERFYTPMQGSEALLPWTAEPEMVPSTGDTERDLDALLRRGFTPMGYTSFNSPNAKTEDARRLAKKLNARYYLVAAQLSSSRSASIPLSVPTSSTSYMQGTASAHGSGGYATGNYSGTTTTYGTQTTYLPITINRFDKMAVFLREAPKVGIGVYMRELTPEEIAHYETRRAVAVRSVRDGSPAYYADILPGDVIVQFNHMPADRENLREALKSEGPITMQLFRNGQARQIEMAVPAEWRPR